jgi:putative N6-adenine-specific DNA methylase
MTEKEKGLVPGREYSLIATVTSGLEAVLARELRLLGYADLIVENGKVTFTGTAADVARCNIRLRTADRVLIRIAEFDAYDFGQLFDRTNRIRWEEMIPVDGKMHVTGKSVKSTLFSVSDCQSIVKKAMVEAMKRKYPRAEFRETGPVYKVDVGLLKDRATLTLDTTGPGLHKRGYRQDTGEAPLRETLAAGLVLLSRWTPERIMADPFCGSGTIAIEAALLAKNIAPGLNRSFVSEGWQQIPGGVWSAMREEARQDIREGAFRIFASDSDGGVIRKARENARNAGVEECIAFQKLGIEEFRSSRKYGCIICNPPYGERSGEPGEVEALYRTMGTVFTELDSWSFFILSAHPHFEKLFGRQADKNRKIYNGNIKCYYYQYLGPLPGRKGAGESATPFHRTSDGTEREDES